LCTDMVATDWRDNLSALPNIDECTTELLPNGDKVIRRKPVKFVPFEFKGTDPFMFTDADGHWFVVYGHEGGPHKRRAP